MSICVVGSPTVLQNPPPDPLLLLLLLMLMLVVVVVMVMVMLEVLLSTARLLQTE